ncbi:helix-turn-helix transcriptional regulator, partial [Priestia megaterium]
MSNIQNDQSLGLLLRSLLKENALSMRKLSSLTGIDTATISRIINGKQQANLHHLKQFAHYLNTPLEAL